MGPPGPGRGGPGEARFLSYSLLGALRQGLGMATIHHVATDLADPPVFRKAKVSPAFPQLVAYIVRAAYPDLRTLHLPGVAPHVAFAAGQKAASAMPRCGAQACTSRSSTARVDNLANILLSATVLRNICEGSGLGNGRSELCGTNSPRASAQVEYYVLGGGAHRGRCCQQGLQVQG